MKFVEPTPAELAALRVDPLLFEQELDVGPAVDETVEVALGMQAGRRHWRASELRLRPLPRSAARRR